MFVIILVFFKFIFSPIYFTVIHSRKNKDTNQYQYSHLLLQNQELKTKCDLLQEKIENLERNNTRLIQRSAQQVNIFIEKIV